MFLNISIDLFFSIIEDEIHVDIIPLQNSTNFSAAFQADNDGLPVERLIQNFQRSSGHRIHIISLRSTIIGVG